MVADLHIHTYFSDSTSSPQEVVEQAIAAGLSCISITDHDTLEGISPTIEAAKGKDLEIISGLELSTELNGRDVHLLGYDFDRDNNSLKEELIKMQDERILRIKEMIERLKKLGITDIAPEEAMALTESKAVGRPHLARMLVEKGHVKNIRAAFDQYLADEAAAFVPKVQPSITEGIRLIREAGGVSVLAHPMVAEIDECIPELVRQGLNGLEVYYPTHSPAVTQYYLKLAKKNGLLVTGGSDAHGSTKRHTYVGRIKIPYELVEDLKSRTQGS